MLNIKEVIGRTKEAKEKLKALAVEQKIEEARDDFVLQTERARVLIEKTTMAIFDTADLGRNIVKIQDPRGNIQDGHDIIVKKFEMYEKILWDFFKEKEFEVFLDQYDPNDKRYFISYCICIRWDAE